MKRIAKFTKVSFDGWKNAFKEFLADAGVIEDANEDVLRKYYGEILLPKRATKGSAGYDFFIPEAVTLKPNQTLKVPTGIRVRMDEGWVLKLYPRSGLGFKYRIQLNNTVGIIDSDYFYSDNEGHIFIKITNDSNENKTMELKKADGFAQGIFVEYGITEDDDCDGVRNGGLGSTSL